MRLGPPSQLKRHTHIHKPLRQSHGCTQTEWCKGHPLITPPLSTRSLSPQIPPSKGSRTRCPFLSGSRKLTLCCVFFHEPSRAHTQRWDSGGRDVKAGWSGAKKRRREVEGRRNPGWVNPTDESKPLIPGSFIPLSKTDDQRENASSASAATISLSCSGIFSTSLFPSLSFSADTERRRWRRGGWKEGRMKSLQASTQPESEKGCACANVWMCVYVCVREVVEVK